MWRGGGESEGGGRRPSPPPPPPPGGGGATLRFVAEERGSGGRVAGSGSRCCRRRRAGCRLGPHAPPDSPGTRGRFRLFFHPGGWTALAPARRSNHAMLPHPRLSQRERSLPAVVRLLRKSLRVFRS